jgi:hypothetical protein
MNIDDIRAMLLDIAAELEAELQEVANDHALGLLDRPTETERREAVAVERAKMAHYIRPRALERLAGERFSLAEAEDVLTAIGEAVSRGAELCHIPLTESIKRTAPELYEGD